MSKYDETKGVHIVKFDDGDVKEYVTRAGGVRSMHVLLVLSLRPRVCCIRTPSLSLV